MTARAQAVNMLEYVPDTAMPILLEVIRRFISYDSDDIATPDDLQAIREYEREKAAGVTISHDDINWD